jgi:PncC family amidohydrolase
MAEAESAALRDLELRAVEAAALLVREFDGGSRTLVLAESCTAGLAADLVARIPGASRVLWGSFVCYTPAAKIAMLGLDRRRLEQYGLVSEETAGDMARSALEKSGASVAASVTGLAGPGGDGSAVPVGVVWAALAWNPGRDAAETPVIAARRFFFQGSRNEIRLRAAAALLEELLKPFGTQFGGAAG